MNWPPCSAGAALMLPSASLRDQQRFVPAMSLTSIARNVCAPRSTRCATKLWRREPMMLTHHQIAATRAWLGWSRETLAEKSGVSLGTIRNLERGNGSVQSAEDVRAAFE